jgi:hypothetical protein
MAWFLVSVAVWRTAGVGQGVDHVDWQVPEQQG